MIPQTKLNEIKTMSVKVERLLECGCTIVDKHPDGNYVILAGKARLPDRDGRKKPSGPEAMYIYHVPRYGNARVITLTRREWMTIEDLWFEGDN